MHCEPKRVTEWRSLVAATPPDVCVIPAWATYRYPQVQGADRRYHLHVMACEMQNGPRPDGSVVRHLCGNDRCSQPAHTRWGTQAENIGDNRRLGVLRQGEQINTAKLNADEVRGIRERHAAGAGIAELAREYGLSYNGMKRVVLRRSWRHV